MATRTAQLAVDVASDVAKAVGGLDDVGAAAKGAGSESERAARKLTYTADQADELGGKAGKATGALGALSSGFELLGPKGAAAATGLQSAALATDFFSGVGDSLNLVMESTIVKTARARVAAIAHGIATKASAVATGIMTAGQWALNAALSANPVFLIVAGTLALVAAVVLAYKKSETFRAIVHAAFHAVQAAASFAFNWIKNNWPLLLAIITGPIGLAVLAVVKNWDTITDKVRVVRKFITDKIGELPSALGAIADDIGDAILAPFQAVEDLIQSILKLIGKIHVPHIPGLGGGRVTSSGSFSSGSFAVVSPTTGTTTPTTSITYQFNLNGLLTDDEAATVIQQIISRNSRLFGVTA